MSKNQKLILIITATIFITLILIALYQRYVSNSALNNPNVQAFLKTIRFAEGTSGPDGYRMMFTGKLFDSFDKHPNIKNSANGITSTAAGAYQFLYRTWAPLAIKLGLTDFTPESQDLAAVEKIRERGALNDVIAGNFIVAVEKVNREWASLPGSPYGQPTKTLAALQSVYQNEGGQYA